MSVKNTILLDGITLESTAAATQADADRVVIDTRNSDKLVLACSYTTGAGETSNACAIKVLGFDGRTWHNLGHNVNTTGAITFVENSYNIAGAAAATTYNAVFEINILFKSIKITAVESGVDTNKGTLTVTASFN